MSCEIKKRVSKRALTHAYKNYSTRTHGRERATNSQGGLTTPFLPLVSDLIQRTPELASAYGRYPPLKVDPIIPSVRLLMDGSTWWSLLTLSGEILISPFRPDCFSSAVIDKMPFAFTSNLTSIWGVARGAGGMPSKVKVPRRLLWAVSALSPSYTFMATEDWLSRLVLNCNYN